MLKKLQFSRNIFEKCPNTIFHENPAGRNRVVPCGWTDGRTDNEAKRVFS